MNTRIITPGGVPHEGKTTNRCMVWDAAIAKVTNSTQYSRLPDMGGIRLLELMWKFWWECAENALTTGRWDFAPLRATFSYRDKLQTLSSVLDRVVVQLALNEPGWQMQNELINGCLDDDLMPIPPAFRFRPLLARHAYSLWFNDYALWKDVQRLYRLRGYAWVAKCDIRNCFYSIPRAAAFDVLRQFMPVTASRKLMEKRIKYPVSHDGCVHDMPTGLPVNEPSSHLLANGYLSGFDYWVVKRLAVPYARYVDDMRFFCKTKSEAEKVLEAVGKYLQVRHGLMVNADKSAIEEINADRDSGAAMALLESLKQRVREPLEEQPVYYRRVPPEEIMQAWNEVRKALDAKKPLGVVEDKLDFLGRLRPTYGCAADFHETMRLMLEYTCSIKTENTEQQRRMASIAMRQMRESGTQSSMSVFKQYADTGEVGIREIAFRNLVACREEGARAQAEDSLLHEFEFGSRPIAEDRLKCYVKTYPLTAKLIDAFASSEDPEIQVILSGPSDDPGVGRAVSLLRDADEQIRRNAALALIRRVPQGDTNTVAALDKALAKEKDRDARLAIMIARGSCTGDIEAFPSSKCHLPRTMLEMEICRAIADKMIPYEPPVAIEPLGLQGDDPDPEAVVPGTYT